MSGSAIWRPASRPSAIVLPTSDTTRPTKGSHLSANLDLTEKAIDAPLRKYRETIASYGFKDFFGIGDLIDGTLGGYSYDDTTLASAITWLRTEAETLRAQGRPWYLAVNFVNPHDVMYFNSDLPTQNVQGLSHAMPIAGAPDD